MNRPRTPEHFPRMKHRARGREIRRECAAILAIGELGPVVAELMADFVDAVHQAMTEPGNAAASRRADDVRRAAREYAARRAAEEDDELRAMLKARIVEALAAHSPLEASTTTREGRAGYEIQCRDCDFEAFAESRPLAVFAEH